MVNYTKPELEVTEFEIVDVLTLSAFQTGNSITSEGSGNWDGGSWY
jgi:hypothetical protein